MTDIEPALQNPDLFIVDRDEFAAELQNYYSGHNTNSKKLQWTRQRIQNIIQLIEDYNNIKSQGKRAMNKHYHYARKYEVVSVCDRKALVLKRKDISKPVLQIIPTEDFYQILLETHIATKHGRRDKIIHVLKRKYVVPVFAVSLFIKLCKTCLSKKSIGKREVVAKSLLLEGFSRRGHIGIVDLQTCPDQEYNWLLNYQDEVTKFCFLRPLKNNHAKEVATEVVKIFLEVGCPNIIESHNHKLTVSVLKEIAILLPVCKLDNGGPGDPNKEYIEHSNGEVKTMIQTWMRDNNSTNWSLGCYFVQFQKNTSYHPTVAGTPYRALFKVDPKFGLSTYTTDNITCKLETEADTDELEEMNYNEEQNSENEHSDEQDDSITDSNMQNQLLNHNSHYILPIDVEIINSQNNNRPKASIDRKDHVYSEINIATREQEISCENIKKETVPEDRLLSYSIKIEPDEINIDEDNILVCKICGKCKKNIHTTCGAPSEEIETFESVFLCNFCVNEHNIKQERTHLYLKREPEEHEASFSKKFKDNILLFTDGKSFIGNGFENS